MKRLALVVVAAALTAVPALAAGPPYNVDLLKVFGPKLRAVKAKTTVPILLPAKLPLLDPLKPPYPSAHGKPNAYEFEIDAAKGCNGANACFVATFSGTRGGKLPFKANARLATGDPAAFHGFSCGGSCSPDSFWYTHKGVLYEFQVKDFPQKAPKAAFVRMANEAIAAGPR
jgi:hypothetical protein